MEPQNQSAWSRLPTVVKVILGIIGGGLFIALLVMQGGNGGSGFSCH